MQERCTVLVPVVHWIQPPESMPYHALYFLWCISQGTNGNVVEALKMLPQMHILDTGKGLSNSPAFFHHFKHFAVTGSHDSTMV